MIIGVLGRGQTLKKYKKYSKIMDKIYIVGYFQNEILKMGIKYFLNKEVVHVVGRGHRGLSKELYEQLNINSVKTPCHSLDHFISGNGKTDFKTYFPPGIEIETVPECMKERGCPPLPIDILNEYSSEFEDYKEMCNFLEIKYSSNEDLFAKRRVRFWPQTGSYAIDLALTEDMPEKLYLFGIDNYSKIDNYSTLYYYPVWADHRKPLNSKMTKFCSYYIGNLAKEYSSTQFYSSSDYFSFDYENWNNI